MNTPPGWDVSPTQVTPQHSVRLPVEHFARTLGGYSRTLRIWICPTQQGSEFEAPDLERGNHIRGVF